MRWGLLVLTSVLATSLADEHRSHHRRVSFLATVPNGTFVRSALVHSAYGVQDGKTENPDLQELGLKAYEVSPTSGVHHTEYVSSVQQPANVFRSTGSQNQESLKPNGLGSSAFVTNEYVTSGRCFGAPPNTAALLPLLGILLEFLHHTTELDKVYLVVSLMKSYLEAVPDSQEKSELLLKLGFVENYALRNEKNSYGGFSEFFNFQNEVKTKIVLNTDLPGLERTTCRDAFEKLLQTSLNVYQEVAKQPECQPNGWQSLFISNTFVQPTEPITFEVVFPKGPTYPPLPHELNPKLPNDFLEKVKYFLEHPNANQIDYFYPPNEKSQPPNNNPYDPYSPNNNNQFGPVNPENNGQFNPQNNNPYGPLYPPNHSPSNPTPPKVTPLYPPNNIDQFYPPYTPEGPYNPNDNYVFNPSNPNEPPQVPTLTMDVLIKLLGIIAPGHYSNNGQVNPLLLQLLMKFLYSVENNPTNQNNVYGPDKNTLNPAALIQLILAQKYPNQNILDNYPQFPSETNPYKLPSFSNGFIELTYILKRPKPLIYQPIYYIKYRLPYQTFVQNFYELIRKKPELQYQPEKLYQELLALSNVTQVSPNLNGYEKKEVLDLVFGNGALIDAKLVKNPSDKSLAEQLELVKNLNSNVGAQQIGLQVLNWLNSTNPSKPMQNNFGNDVNYFQLSQDPYKYILQALGKGVPIGGKFTSQVVPVNEEINGNTNNYSGNSGRIFQFSQIPLGSSSNQEPYKTEVSNSKGSSIKVGTSKPSAFNEKQIKGNNKVPRPTESSKFDEAKEVSKLFEKHDDKNYKRFYKNV